MIPDADEPSHFPNCLDDFRLGHEVLDREHEGLRLLINQLAEAVDDQDDWEKAVALATELVHETSRHFDHEETLMKQAAYPEVDRHHEQHTELLSQIESLRDRLATDQRLARPHQTLNFLGDWFTLHIDNSDRRFVAFLSES